MHVASPFFQIFNLKLTETQFNFVWNAKHARARAFSCTPNEPNRNSSSPKQLKIQTELIGLMSLQGQQGAANSCNSCEHIEKGTKRKNGSSPRHFRKISFKVGNWNCSNTNSDTHTHTHRNLKKKRKMKLKLKLKRTRTWRRNKLMKLNRMKIWKWRKIPLNFGWYEKRRRRRRGWKKKAKRTRAEAAACEGER